MAYETGSVLAGPRLLRIQGSIPSKPRELTLERGGLGNIQCRTVALSLPQDAEHRTDALLAYCGVSAKR